MRIIKKITIERATEEKNAVGDRVKTWSTLLTTWAEIEPGGGSEKYESAEKTAVSENSYKIRYSSSSAGITEKDRIKDGSKYFDIRAIAPIERNKHLKLVCDTR